MVFPISKYYNVILSLENFKFYVPALRLDSFRKQKKKTILLILGILVNFISFKGK